MPTTTLNYLPPEPARAAPTRRSLLWIVLALPTVAIPFVDMACDTSPAKVFYRVATKRSPTGGLDLELFTTAILATCLCYGALAFGWRLWARWHRTPPAVRTVFICLGLTSAVAWVVTLSSVLLLSGDPPSENESVSLLTSFACTMVCVGLFVAPRRLRGNDVVLGALLTPFIIGGAFCIVGFFDERRIGWYLTSFAVPVSLVEMFARACTRSTLAQRETAGNLPAVVIPVDAESALTPSRPAPP